MIHLNLDQGGTAGLQILCLGSHADDIEIGCGGTLLRLAEQYPGRTVVPVDARPLFTRGGGVHCITQHQPSPLRAAL